MSASSRVVNAELSRIHRKKGSPEPQMNASTAAPRSRSWPVLIPALLLACSGVAALVYQVLWI